MGYNHTIIWGTGKEGMAAAQLLRETEANPRLTFVDEQPGGTVSGTLGDLAASCDLVQGSAAIAAALAQADRVIKSPGVSLYHPLLTPVRARGVPITSLLNLWFEQLAQQPQRPKIIGVTGTKGKSTTATLLSQMLNALGQKTQLCGNIGVPLSRQAGQGCAFIVIEISSYQAANFSGQCDAAVLTSLYEEHLDWHGSVARYYADKVNLLRHADSTIINHQALPVLQAQQLTIEGAVIANSPAGFHNQDGVVYQGATAIGAIENPTLARPHNAANLCTALAVLTGFAFSPAAALASTKKFVGLPHRQQELGEKNGLLFVDDSIATTPQAALAALAVYCPKPITLIAGGFDRGIDYTPLAEYLLANPEITLVWMGPSGQRIATALNGRHGVFPAPDMGQAVALAVAHTPPGGIILLSPAAPSYGLFKDFIARGKAFAAAAGF